ncbi:predicted protein [Sclerotinia sclerotiorum 1980 UF-70]|uniref:Uncharacterized protein n=1 Tax=Sclerotinia sclerotiorum (strain ATCC 18683 / 1980 / Ss-1) TaxID=665079 RepID=A7EI31_SCLS1|nr:predicted protein [Sclerotinia sclerotiorum 1980 UF-70]EDO02497.1 predicted protein [Sclerotinia sclerotiorum 1980 UF-70]
MVGTVAVIHPTIIIFTLLSQPQVFKGSLFVGVSATGIGLTSAPYLDTRHFYVARMNCTWNMLLVHCYALGSLADIHPILDTAYFNYKISPAPRTQMYKSSIKLLPRLKKSPWCYELSAYINHPE